MRCPQVVEMGLADSPNYSDLKVMNSEAGFYLGASYIIRSNSGKIIDEQPGSRCTGYFATVEQAQACLEDMEADEAIRIAHSESPATP